MNTHQQNLLQMQAPIQISTALISQDMAVIAARLDGSALTTSSLVWEVFEQAAFELAEVEQIECDPVRFGLCLAVANEMGEVRVPVVGLKPGNAYSFRFIAGAQSSPEGHFVTAQAIDLSHCGSAAMAA